VAHKPLIPPLQDSAGLAFIPTPSELVICIAKNTTNAFAIENHSKQAIMRQIFDVRNS
jgi:hypothetical protein